MAWDVVVLGATIAGLTAARRFAADGFAVTVLDPNPELASASIGHGVAASAHASTVANMAAAFGDAAAHEHVRRNLAGLEEIRRVGASGALELPEVELHDHSLGVALDRELEHVRRLICDGGAEVSFLERTRTRARAAAGLCSTALLIEPAAYAATLAEQAVAFGVRLVHDVTVVHLKRLDGVTEVAYRHNLAWSRDVEMVTGHAVVDTLGISPWGSLAGIGVPQHVPVLWVPGVTLDEVTLLAGPPVWLMRPADDGALLLGPKCTATQLPEAATALANWAVAEFGACGGQPGQLVIDPSDHGRPIVGASAIPGGFYTRGNGRGELMNGTASGCYLAALLLGTGPARGVALPLASKLRAGVERMIKGRRGAR